MASRSILIGTLAACVLAVGCFAAGSATVGGAQTAQVSTQLKAAQAVADEFRVNQIEVVSHRALATKDPDLMMTIFTDDAVMTTATGEIYTGKASIRTFWTTVAPAMKPENHWAPLIPAYKSKVSLSGDTAQLTYECHMVEIGTNQIKAQHRVEVTAVRSGLSWLARTMKSTNIQLS